MASALTIVGLGPGNPIYRTVEAVSQLNSAQRIILRTSVHPGTSDLDGDPRVSSCDDLYSMGNSFDEVYDSIVNRVLQALTTGPVVYAVPGHPLFGERTVTSILERARKRGIHVDIVPGLSA